MRSVRNIYHHSYTLSFLPVFVFFILFHHHGLSINTNTLSSTESLTISSSRTIVSPGDDFELGFFKPLGTSSYWYLGMWYKKIPKRTYVWVANRDNPLTKSMGTLKISNNNLVIVDDQYDKPVWSTNLTKEDVISSPLVAELLANGNFVLRYSNNNDRRAFLWQSFDFPTDTLLPKMKLGYNLKTGRNRFLRSWRSLDDPSSGSFLYKLENRGFPEFFLYKNDLLVHPSGPWNGIQNSGIREEQQLNYILTENTKEVAYMFLVTNHSIQSRLTLSNEGVLHQLTWIPPARGWILLWSSPMVSCDLYQTCGAYSYCDTNMLPRCNCMRGFKPLSMQKWKLGDGSSGCVRRTPLSCDGDEFLRMEKMKLPDTTMATVNKRIGVVECKIMCLRDCKCIAYANTDIRNGGFGCVIWTSELSDVRNYDSAGHDLYVRMAASDHLEDESVTCSSEDSYMMSRKVKGFFIGISVVFLLIVIALCLW